MTVAVLYDDSSITPRALQRAADAYRKANNEPEAEKALQELQQRFPDFGETSQDFQRELMKHLLFLVLTAAMAFGQQPTLKEQALPAIKGSILLPDGWHTERGIRRWSHRLSNQSRKGRERRGDL